MKKIMAAMISTSLILISTPAVAHNGVVHKTPKRGQFCPKAAIGHKHTGLKCTLDGSRARWK